VNQEVIFLVPKKYVSPDDLETRDKICTPWINGWSLKQYYDAVRHTRRLQMLNLRMTVRRLPSREPVRTSYVPKPGETFIFVKSTQSLG